MTIKKTLTIILLLLILFMLSVFPAPEELVHYEDGTLRYPADLKTSGSEAKSSNTYLLYEFGLDSNEIQGEIGIAYGGFYASNMDDLKAILSNERFVADFESEHQVVIPDQILVPACQFENGDFGAIVTVHTKLFKENVCTINIVMIPNVVVDNILAVSSVKKLDKKQLKIETRAITIQTKDGYFTKEHNGKQIRCIPISGDSKFDSGFHYPGQEQTIYLWEEDGFIGMVYMDEPYNESHLKYCELEEYRIR